MAKRERPAQQQGNGGNGGGSWQPNQGGGWEQQSQGGGQQAQGGVYPQAQGGIPQQPFAPPPPEQRAQYEAAPGRYMPQMHPQGLPPQPPQMPPTIDQMIEFETAPGRHIFHNNGRATWTPPSFPPPPSENTPAGMDALGAPLPIGTKATHFSGPIVSGGLPQVPVWPDFASLAVGGSAMLSTTLAIDFGMGNFMVPLQFPSDALITGFAMATVVQFTTPPSFQVGKTPGAGDIAGGSLPAPGGPLQFQPATGQLPLWDAAPPQRPFLAFLTVSGNTGGTAGLGFVLLQYVRIPQRWT